MMKKWQKTTALLMSMTVMMFMMTMRIMMMMVLGSNDVKCNMFENFFVVMK